MLPIKSVLVATDFSPASEAALSYGGELARLFHAKLHVLHVVSDLASSEDLLATYVPDMGNAQNLIEMEAREALHKFVGNRLGPHPPVDEAVVTSPSVASAILAHAAGHHVGLIVVGTHGRTRLSHLLLGSVAEHLVGTSTVPILTVRHHERVNAMTREPAMAGSER